MEVFLVGGFVRDQLLGLSPNDRDYVVVGESPASMLEKGFTQVGSHFPVFLHPETKEEHALARCEASTGKGYNDFTYTWDGVTLEEDLSRRDLTINAMAIDADGNVVDLFGGREDLKQGILRHVSPAFKDDPLRVIRVARFAATYGFCIAEETMVLMREMAAADMLQALPGERVWKETEKALLSKYPVKYFQALEECGALAVWFPELDAMEHIPQRPDYHAEGNTWIHTMMVLNEAVLMSQNLDRERQLRIRFAALTHDFGKLVTPKELLWGPDGEIIGKHHGHEDPDRFGPLLMAFVNRLTIPSRLRKFAWVVAVVHQNVHGIKKMSPRGLENLFDKVGGNRAVNGDMHYLMDITITCFADNLGRYITKEDGSLAILADYPQGDYFLNAMYAINAVDAGAIIRKQRELGRTLEHGLDCVKAERKRAAKAFIKNHLD